MDAQTDRLARLLRAGSQTGQSLCDQMSVSPATLSRLMKDCENAYPGFLCRIGAARSTRYAWAKAVEDVAGQPWVIHVYQVDRQGALQSVGRLTVLEADEYRFERSADEALSVSGQFPDGWLREHYEGVPWFLQDGRPQGYLGRALAQRWFGQDGGTAVVPGLPEHVHQWNDHQVLRVISCAGDDLPGNFLIGRRSAERLLSQRQQEDTRVIRAEDRPAAYAQRVHDLVSGQWIPHSSAGGEQPKFTACVIHASNAAARQVIVKFSPPEQDESRAAQRWRDLLLAEFHALSVLTAHGLPSAMTDVIRGGDGRWFMESTRFDRVGRHGRAPAFSLRSILIEDVGDLPGWTVAAETLHGKGRIDASTMEQIGLLDAYGHFIGNTDRHPGNLSLTLDQHAGPAKFVLAPAYDMLPMQYAPDAQGSLVPEFRPMAAYPAEHGMVSMARDLAMLFWAEVARDQRVSQDFREIAMAHAEAMSPDVFDGALYAGREDDAEEPTRRDDLRMDF